MEEINVLVIGNGFDIHHGMKTKYTDFLEFVKDYKNNKNIQPIVSIYDEIGQVMDLIYSNNFINFFENYHEQVKGWIDFESLIKEIIESIDSVIKNMIANKGVYTRIQGSNKYNYADECSDKFKTIIAESFDKLFRFNSSMIFLKEEYQNNIVVVDKDKITKILHKELDDLRDIMALYFKYYELGRRYEDDKDVFTYKQIVNMNIDRVITFNYTNTYERYGINPINVTHIHGKAMETCLIQNEENVEVELNSIVLGYQDDKEEELDFVYFKKYFQCLCFNTDLVTDKCFSRRSRVGFEQEDFAEKFLLEGAAVIVHIFGHSLDKTDKEKLIPVFNKADIVKIYCLDEKDFEAKVIKVLDLLGKKIAVEKIYGKQIKFIRINFERYNSEVENEDIMEEDMMLSKLRRIVI